MQVWRVLTRDHAVLPTTHMFIHKLNEPSYLYFSTALWPVLVYHVTGDRRLSWPGRLCKILTWFARPKMVAHASTSRGGRESNSRPLSRKSNARSSPVWGMVVALKRMTRGHESVDGSAKDAGSCACGGFVDTDVHLAGKCTFAANKAKFSKAFNSIFGKIGRIASIFPNFYANKK